LIETKCGELNKINALTKACSEKAEKGGENLKRERATYEL
jgi:hypothetical protein